MKIIKINKTYRGGTKVHYLVLFDEPYTDDDINHLVEEWCVTDPSGSNYGYSYEWEFVEDDQSINYVLMEKMNIIDRDIERLQRERSEMVKNLKYVLIK